MRYLTVIILFLALPFSTTYADDKTEKQLDPIKPGWEILFSTEFDDQSDWPTSPNIIIENGYLQIEQQNKSSFAVQPFKLDGLSDFKVEAILEETSENKGGFGITWGENHQTKANYSFRIRNDGSLTISHYQGKPHKTTRLYQEKESPHLPIAFWGGVGINKLTIEKKGAFLHFSLNNKEITKQPYTGLEGVNIGFRLSKEQVLKVHSLAISQNTSKKAAYTTLAGFTKDQILDEIVFSKDGNRITTLTYKGRVASISVWDNQGKSIKLAHRFIATPVPGKENKTNSLFTLKRHFAISADGGQYVYISGLNSITSYNHPMGMAPSPKEIKTSHYCNILALSPQGKRLALASDKHIFFRDMNTGKETKPTATGHRLKLFFSPTGDHLFSINEEGYIHRHVTDGSNGTLGTAPQFTPDGKQIILVNSKNQREIYPIDSWDKPIFTSSQEITDTVALAFGANNQLWVVSKTDDQLAYGGELLYQNQLLNMSTKVTNTNGPTGMLAFGYDKNNSEFLIGHERGILRSPAISNNILEAQTTQYDKTKQAWELFKAGFNKQGVQLYKELIDADPVNPISHALSPSNVFPYNILDKFKDLPLIHIADMILHRYKTLEKRTRAKFGFEWEGNDSGAIITKITAGLPMAKGGIKVGDIVLTINGHSINQESLTTYNITKKLQPKTKAIFKIKRQGQVVDVEVTPESRFKHTILMAGDLYRYGYVAAFAGHPGLTEQAADKLEQFIKDNADQFKRVQDAMLEVTILRASALAYQDKTDEAYDYILSHGGIKNQSNDWGVRNIKWYPEMFYPLLSNPKKMAYLMQVEVDKVPTTSRSHTSVQPYLDLSGTISTNPEDDFKPVTPPAPAELSMSETLLKQGRELVDHGQNKAALELLEKGLYNGPASIQPGQFSLYDITWRFKRAKPGQKDSRTKKQKKNDDNILSQLRYEQYRAYTNLGEHQNAYLALKAAYNTYKDYSYIEQLSWIYSSSPIARFRNGNAAISYAKRVTVKKTGVKYQLMLAAAYAESNQFDTALEIINTITSSTEKISDQELLEIKKHKDLYQQHIPFRLYGVGQEKHQKQPKAQIYLTDAEVYMPDGEENPTWEWLVKPKFDMIGAGKHLRPGFMGFNKAGFAQVDQERYWRLIDPKGHIVFSSKSGKWPASGGDMGIFTTRSGPQCIYVDKDNVKIFEQTFYECGDFYKENGGVTVARKKRAKRSSPSPWLLINTKGETLLEIEDKEKSALYISEKTVRVHNAEGLCGYYTLGGEPITPVKYKECTTFKDGIALVSAINGDVFTISPQGKESSSKQKHIISSPAKAKVISLKSNDSKKQYQKKYVDTDGNVIWQTPLSLLDLFEPICVNSEGYINFSLRNALGSAYLNPSTGSIYPWKIIYTDHGPRGSLDILSSNIPRPTHLTTLAELKKFEIRTRSETEPKREGIYDIYGRILVPAQFDRIAGFSFYDNPDGTTDIIAGVEQKGLFGFIRISTELAPTKPAKEKIITKEEPVPQTTTHDVRYPALAFNLLQQAEHDYRLWKETKDPERFQRALFNVESALAVEPEKSELWFFQGVLLSELKADPESMQLALTSFLKAVSLNPEHGRAQVMLAQTLFNNGLYTEAIAQIHFLFNKDSNMITPQFTSLLATSYIAAGQSKKGSQYFLSASFLHPQSVDIKIALAVLLKDQGQTTNALNSLQLVINDENASQGIQRYATTLSTKWQKESK